MVENSAPSLALYSCTKKKRLVYTVGKHKKHSGKLVYFLKSYILAFIMRGKCLCCISKRNTRKSLKAQVEQLQSQQRSILDVWPCPLHFRLLLRARNKATSSYVRPVLMIIMFLINRPHIYFFPHVFVIIF